MPFIHPPIPSNHLLQLLKKTKQQVFEAQFSKKIFENCANQLHFINKFGFLFLVCEVDPSTLKDRLVFLIVLGNLLAGTSADAHQQRNIYYSDPPPIPSNHLLQLLKKTKQQVFEAQFSKKIFENCANLHFINKFRFLFLVCEVDPSTLKDRLVFLIVLGNLLAGTSADAHQQRCLPTNFRELLPHTQQSPFAIAEKNKAASL